MLLTLKTELRSPVNPASMSMSASSPMAMANFIACLNQPLPQSASSLFSKSLSVGPPSDRMMTAGANEPAADFMKPLR